MDFDKQFEDDLEKATALSLETLAMEQYRRNKLQCTLSDVSTSTSIYKSTSHNTIAAIAAGSSAHTTRPRPGSLNNSSSTSNLKQISSAGSIAPPPLLPPRSCSETRQITRDGPDLISFNISDQDEYHGRSLEDCVNMAEIDGSPANKSSANDSHSNFRQMVDEMHKLNSQLQDATSKYALAGTPTLYGYGPGLMASNNMQLMPYPAVGAATTATPNPFYPQQTSTPNHHHSHQAAASAAGATSNAKIPLTPDQLTALYSMGPYAMTPRPPPSQISQYAQQPYGFAPVQSPITPQLLGQHPFGHNQYQAAVGNSAFNSTPPAAPATHHQHFAKAMMAIHNDSATATNFSTYSHDQQPLQQPQHIAAALQHPSAGLAAGTFGANAVANPESALVHVPKLPPRQNSMDAVRQSLSKLTTNDRIASQSHDSNVSASQLPPARGVPRRVSTTKPLGDDLIDLDNGIEDNSRVSVLEAFDPLMIADYGFDNEDGDAVSDCATSYYSENDPFDYLYSCGTQYSDPVYEAVNKIDRTPLSPGATIGWNQTHPFSAGNHHAGGLAQPPPLPPRNNKLSSMPLEKSVSISAMESESDCQSLDRRKMPTKLYENVIIKKTYDAELVAFFKMVKEIRSEYKCADEKTNIGHVVATEFNNNYVEDTSIKLLVHPLMKAFNVEAVVEEMAEALGSGSGGDERRSRSSTEGISVNNEKGSVEGYGPPVVFTCDICTTVEHVIMHVFCELENALRSSSVDDYILKPIGINEWLLPTSKLSQLECVHNSIKLEQDVQLGLWPKDLANLKSIARTQQDDVRDADLKLEDILAHEQVQIINYDNLMILLETLEDEISKLESTASDARPHTILSCSGVLQAVKHICALLGSVDSIDITDEIDALKAVCAQGQTVYGYRDSGVGGSMLDVVSEKGDYAEVKLRPKTVHEQIKHRCCYIRDAVQSLIDTYAHAFRVDFCVNVPDYYSNPIPIANVSESIVVNVMCLHRIPPSWRHDDYMLGAQIYHGSRYIGDAVVTQCSNEISGLFSRLRFDSWMNFENIPICTLPRESRLIFVLYGCTTEPTEGTNNADASDSAPDRKVTKVELGWSSVQFFDYERNMIKGTYLLSIWPPTTDKFLGPAPARGTHPHGDICPILSISVPDYGGQIVFPEPPRNNAVARCLDFNSLDLNLQQELIDTAEQGYPSALDKREVLWEKRYYLQSLPHALPKILHAAHSWDFASAVDIHALVRSWRPLSPLQTLELFLPRYPDMEVRAQAVNWVMTMPNDQLIEFLPQFLQALKHDTYEASPMAAFLLRRSLESPRIAHHLYWLLVHSLPGDSPQNSVEQQSSNDSDESLITQARYNRRNQMMLRALLAVCGEKLSARFLAQNMMCKNLADIAQNVKVSKESMRQKVLVQGMEQVNQILLERPTALPLGPACEVTGVSTRTCSYFNSNTLPIKINFNGPDRMLLPAIFKAGDDLQQDMLTIQLVRVMDRLWLEEGLDLKMVTFNCVPTGYKRGMIEMITDAETLRKIQVEWGLTGSFKDKPIAEWLGRQNPSQLEYQRAVHNFTVSCAGYSVVTYILGICDRHNDNIMLKTSGHLFHIDFGKFLGDAQMFGNFKRDRTPFVLTSDMAYVINMGDRPSIKFQHFVDLCCDAFNIVRKHGDLLLHMLALMATSGIPGVNADAVNYVRNALLPGQSNPEAAASFAKMIHISLKSWFTQFNFFLHNLAQIRFTGAEGSGDLLSFVPRTYTMAQDGRLKSVTVYGFQKRYDLEKYYTYILMVTRQNQPDPAYLFRSYKEFLEFHQKLCIHFPLAKLHSLPSGIHVGRSNIKTVADRRLPEIRQFLISLFHSADEIAHSDLVYTFFHPLLRDQQEQDIHVAKVKETRAIANPTERVRGELKLSLQYHRGALTVMIHHARSLPATTSGQEPNTYVKTYLKPDPAKSTKRKTKVVRKNCFPSFMETLEYRMPIEHIQNRVLQVTVWSHDSLQENEFLGGVELHLSEMNLRDEFVKWCTLGYISRS